MDAVVTTTFLSQLKKNGKDPWFSLMDRVVKFFWAFILFRLFLFLKFILFLLAQVHCVFSSLLFLTWKYCVVVFSSSGWMGESSEFT